ncbi:MAG TPA: DUF1318 domain-containing protein [Candidatus Hydrogenedentes bacterium]|nr:DUF1318 domain-containing protein [Candidatus Hydrogenedentota bacterium]
MRMRIGFAAAVVLLLATVGCVIRTEHRIDAHITLDIRHIAAQAENVLDFVEGKTDTLPGLEAEPAAGPQSRARAVLEFFSPMGVAHADTLKVTTSPLVKEIAVRMRDRNPRVEAIKAPGCFGENNRGYLELRECDALGDNEKRNEAQKLLAEENKDRKALYNEIARLNADTGVTVSAVEGIYALERLRRAKTGEVFQLPAAGADFDSVKASDLGARLGDKCVPGAWVTV